MYVFMAGGSSEEYILISEFMRSGYTRCTGMSSFYGISFNGEENGINMA